MKIDIWTDGACSGNPGPGGWAALLVARHQGKKHTKELSGSKAETTNNEMELLGVLEALKALKGPGHELTVFTDSQLVHGYLMRGWKCKSSHLRTILGEICALRDLQGYKLTIIKIPGHTGDPMNERVDALAKAAVVAARAPSRSVARRVVLQMGGKLEDLPPL